MNAKTCSMAGGRILGAVRGRILSDTPSRILGVVGFRAPLSGRLTSSGRSHSPSRASPAVHSRVDCRTLSRFHSAREYAHSRIRGNCCRKTNAHQPHTALQHGEETERDRNPRLARGHRRFSRFCSQSSIHME